MAALGGHMAFSSRRGCLIWKPCSLITPQAELVVSQQSDASRKIPAASEPLVEGPAGPVRQSKMKSAVTVRGQQSASGKAPGSHTGARFCWIWSLVHYLGSHCSWCLERHVALSSRYCLSGSSLASAFEAANNIRGGLCLPIAPRQPAYKGMWRRMRAERRLMGMSSECGLSLIGPSWH